MIQVQHNTGILSDDYLDALRYRAMVSIGENKLKAPIAAYIQALELRIIDSNHTSKRKFVEDNWQNWVENDS